MVVEGSEFVIMGDKPKLGATVSRCHVGSEKAENVFVSKQDCTKDKNCKIKNFYKSRLNRLFEIECTLNFTCKFLFLVSTRLHRARRKSLRPRFRLAKWHAKLRRICLYLCIRLSKFVWPSFVEREEASHYRCPT